MLNCLRAAVRPWCPVDWVKGREFTCGLAGGVCPCPLSVCQSLAPLALVLTAGGLTLNLPCALLVCAVADCTLVNLHLSAGWYDCCVRVAVGSCGWHKRKKQGQHFQIDFTCSSFCIVSHNWGRALKTENAQLALPLWFQFTAQIPSRPKVQGKILCMLL